jgi:hypothetical protein
MDRASNCLAQLIRFFVMELIHLDLNHIFNICVVFMTNYFFNGRWRPVDSETFLLTDFVNLKIKLIQSFGCTYRGRVYIYMFIGMSAHTYISNYICNMFLKKEKTERKLTPCASAPSFHSSTLPGETGTAGCSSLIINKAMMPHAHRPWISSVEAKCHY